MATFYLATSRATSRTRAHVAGLVASQLAQHPRVSRIWTRCTTDFGHRTLRKRVVFSRGETHKQSSDWVHWHNRTGATVFRAGQHLPPSAAAAGAAARAAAAITQLLPGSGRSEVVAPPVPRPELPPHGKEQGQILLPDWVLLSSHP